MFRPSSPSFFEAQSPYTSLTGKLNERKRLHEEIIEQIKNTSDVNTLRDNNSQQTLLHFAAKNGMLDIIELLIQKGANAESLDHNDYQPLHYAIQYNQLAAGRLLAQHTAQEVGRPGNQLLREAVNRHSSKDSRLEMIQFLLDLNVELNDQTKNVFGDTVLHTAVKVNCDSSIVEALLKAGANMNLKNFSRKMPYDLVLALQDKTLEISKKLNAAHIEELLLKYEAGLILQKSFNV